jgi:hypothetical protein
MFLELTKVMTTRSTCKSSMLEELLQLGLKTTRILSLRISLQSTQWRMNWRFLCHKWVHRSTFISLEVHMMLIDRSSERLNATSYKWMMSYATVGARPWTNSPTTPCKKATKHKQWAPANTNLISNIMTFHLSKKQWICLRIRRRVMMISSSRRCSSSMLISSRVRVHRSQNLRKSFQLSTRRKTFSGSLSN